MAKADNDKKGDKKTSIRIDPDLWKEARVQALKDDMTIGEMIETALGQYLKKPKKEGK